MPLLLFPLCLFLRRSQSQAVIQHTGHQTAKLINVGAIETSLSAIIFETFWMLNSFFTFRRI